MQVSRCKIRAHCRPPPRFKGDRATTRSSRFGSLVVCRRVWWQHGGSCVRGRASPVLAVPGWTRTRTKRQGPLALVFKGLPNRAGRLCAAAVQKLSKNPQQWQLVLGRTEGKGIPHPILTPAETGASQYLFVFPSEPLSHHPWERRA